MCFCAVLQWFAYRYLAHVKLILHTKSKAYESNIQNPVLREQKQGEKRYCPYHGTGHNQRQQGAVQLQAFRGGGHVGHQSQQSLRKEQGSP